VPADVLARHGIAVVDPDDQAQRPALHAAALDLLELADAYYESARLGLAALPLRSAWAVAAARRVYRGIGAEIRRRGPEGWTGRVSTSAPRKLALTAAALGDVLASRFAFTDKPRGELWRRP
jgi:phytoene synthase